MVWPLVCRRLEGFPNITSTQLFEELCIQFPGRFHPKHVDRLAKRVKLWRQDARARGVVIEPLNTAASATSLVDAVPFLSASGSLAADASISGIASGPYSRGTSHRISSALPWILSQQPSAYAAASCTGLAPRGHSAVDLRDEGPDSRSHRHCMSHRLAPIGTGLLPPSGGRLPCRLAVYNQIGSGREYGMGPVTSPMRHSVTKLREAIRGFQLPHPREKRVGLKILRCRRGGVHGSAKYITSRSQCVVVLRVK